MHYIIDGYNLLFRLLHNDEDLQHQRQTIICDLDKKISLVKINVSIVFDAAFQIGGSTRTHYHDIEIFFTAEGETADEYILDEIKNSLSPQHETVVTSDKKLAHLVRNRLAHTESVENFISWLNRAYKNKQRKIKKQPLILPSPISPPLVIPQHTSLDAYTDYYHQVFESEWQEILAKEKKKKLLSPKPKKRLDPFEIASLPEEKQANETERWLKIFEKRLKEENN